tara:strand:+ start:165 stop:290 length:126 start_codon:yes stop_codon:yes gene_type:complete
MKKRKLNSKNPKWFKGEKPKEYRKVLKKETPKFKMYFCYGI